jgi:hypothetical protein
MMLDEQEVLQAFFREPGGTWRCVAPVTIDHPLGRIQVTPGTQLSRGTSFMGVDLAGWLELRHIAHPA